MQQPSQSGPSLNDLGRRRRFGRNDFYRATTKNKKIIVKLARNEVKPRRLWLMFSRVVPRVGLVFTQLNRNIA